MLPAASAGGAFIGKAISADWFFRDSTLPPKRESILPKQVSISDSSASAGVGKAFEFRAFGKTWRMEGVVNTALFDKDKTPFETRTEQGDGIGRIDVIDAIDAIEW